MNRVTFRWPWAILLCLALTSIAVSAPAAQNSDNTEEVVPSVAFTLEGSSEPFVAHLIPADEGRRQRASLIISQGSKTDATLRQIARFSVPDEVLEPYFEHRVQARAIAHNAFALLFEFIPQRELGAPVAASTYQTSVLLFPTRSTQRWKASRIDDTKYSLLDGGPMMALTDDSPYARLTRVDASQTTYFCGLGEREHPIIEVFDNTRNQFRVESDFSTLIESIPVVVASRPTSRFSNPGLIGYYSWIWASSDIRSPPNSAMAIRPFRLGDLDLSTAWVENSPGLGYGEYATASIHDAIPLQGFRIAPGYGKDQNTFERHAYPTRLLASLSDGSRYVIELPPMSFEELRQSGGYVIELPTPVRTYCLTIAILEASAGIRAPPRGDPDRRQSVAISAITPLSMVYAPTIQQTAINVVDFIAQEPDLPRRDDISQMASALGFDLREAVYQRVVQGTEQQKQRVIPLLGTLPATMALPVLTDLFTHISSEATEYRSIKRTLAQIGPEAATHLLELMDSLEIDSKKLIDTIRLLGRIAPPSQIELLIPSLGEGPEMLRNERVRAIANAGIELVPSLIEYARRHIDSSAGYDALRALHLIGQRFFNGEQLIAVSTQHSAYLLETIELTRQRRPLILALIALQHYAVADTIERLQALGIFNHTDPLVRRAAVQSIQHTSDSKARIALEAALRDASPDVRIAAIRALSSREDRGESIPEILAYADRETWSQGLHHAFQLLAATDVPAAHEYIRDVIVSDIQSERAIIAIRGLKRYDRTIPTQDIESLLIAPSTPFQARRQLIDLLALSTHTLSEDLLLTIYTHRDYFSNLESPDNQLTLRRHATLALGARRSEKARELFIDDVLHGATFEQRRVSLRALGFYADEEIIITLEAWISTAPKELHSQINDTISMIRNRIAIHDIQDELQQTRDSISSEDDP